MTVPVVGFEEGEAGLDWLDVADAIAAGHERPPAQVEDVFLRRGGDTMLNRSAWIDGLGLAVKIATVFPGNAAAGTPTIAGAMALFDDTDGSLRAYLDFRLVTKWKTAADSLLAARRLARPDSREILILGAGTVARSLIDAYRAGFPDARITLWNRTRARAEAMASEVPGTAVAGDLPEAVGRSDIVASATMSTEPVIRGAWLRPGTHLDLIGAYRPDMREADDAALRRARIFVDARGTTLHHIGELKIPLEAGTISEADVVADYREPDLFRRRADEEITLFKNGGGAHLDLMVAHHILAAWTARQG